MIKKNIIKKKNWILEGRKEEENGIINQRRKRGRKNIRKEKNN